MIETRKVEFETRPTGKVGNPHTKGDISQLKSDSGQRGTSRKYIIAHWGNSPVNSKRKRPDISSERRLSNRCERILRGGAVHRAL